MPSASFGQAPDTTHRDSAAARLPEVVVRALRFPTAIGDAPYSVARNGRDVTQRGRAGLAIDDALQGIAGVQVDNRFNFALGERLTVRGFGARTQFGIRGVRVLVDGIPATLPDGQTTLNHLDPGTITAVEAVRTPIAALYGNAAGGVVAFETLAPADVPLRESARYVAGAHDLRRTAFALAGRSGRDAYAVSVGRLSYGGYRAHASADNRYASARTGTEIGTTRLDVITHFVRYHALNPGALPDSMLRSRRGAAFPTNVSQRTGERGEHTQAGIVITQPLGAHTLRVTTHGIRRTLDNPIPPRIIDLSRRAGGVRAAVSSPATRAVEWEAGIESATQRDERRNYVNSGGARGTLTLDQRERVRAAALFAAARTSLPMRLSAHAGVRRDRFDFAVTDRLITTTNPDDSGERRMGAWSPSLGVSFRAARRVTLFANAGTAFETPTTTELANQPTGAGGFNPQLGPQRTRSTELGANFTGGRASAQIVAYRARVSDMLVPFEVPATPGRQFFRNAASAAHSGLEIIADAELARWAGVRAAYSRTDARYRTYAVGTTDFARNRIPGVAPDVAQLRLRASRARAYLDTDVRYQSRTPVNDANSAHSPGYALVHIRGGLDEARIRRLRLSPYVGIQNALDRLYNTSVVINAAGGRYFEPGPGRTMYFGGELSYDLVERRDR